MEIENVPTVFAHMGSKFANRANMIFSEVLFSRLFSRLFAHNFLQSFFKTGINELTKFYNINTSYPEVTNLAFSFT